MTAETSAAHRWSTGTRRSPPLARLVKPGPKVTPEEAHAVVADLRRLALEAEDHVRAFTGLAPGRRPRPGGGRRPPRLGGRQRPGLPGAARAGVDKLAAKRPPGPLTRAVGAKVSGRPGRRDPQLPRRQDPRPVRDLPAGRGGSGPAHPGRAQHRRRRAGAWRSTRRTSGSGSACTRSPTRRSSPPCRGCATTCRARSTPTSTPPTSTRPRCVKRLLSAVGSLAEAIRGDESVSLVEAVQTPEQQRVILDRLTAVMTLLEGHAEYVMDAVGPQVVPERRQDPQGLRRAAQADDAVRPGGPPAARPRRQDAPVRRGPRVRPAPSSSRSAWSGFNRVWTSPETLPTRAEITDPDAWIARVLGDVRVRPVTRD